MFRYKRDRPELVGGMVEIATDRVKVSFNDAGQDWVVDYAAQDIVDGS